MRRLSISMSIDRVIYYSSKYLKACLRVSLEGIARATGLDVAYLGFSTSTL